MRADHRVGEGHEEVVEQVERVVALEPVDGPSRHGQVSVGGAGDVGLELGQQAGNEVDRAPELGHLLEVKRHAQVILGGMKPDPGHRVFTRHVVGIIGLVLMPHQSQRY